MGGTLVNEEVTVTALPWIERQKVDPNHQYVAMASRLPLKSHGAIEGFLRGTLAIRHQLGKTSGLVGYALNAQLGRKTFWTFSVWDNQTKLDAFAPSDPHHHIIQQLKPRMGQSTFRFFRSPPAAFPSPGTK